MSIEQAVLEQLRALSPDQQLQVLDFTESLRRMHRGPMPPGAPLKSLEGALSHLGAKVNDQDIADARREMWGNFPRDPNP